MKLSRTQFFVLLLFVCALILLVPSIVRLLGGNSSLINQESYYHLGVSQNSIASGSYPLSTTPTLFHFLVGAFLSFLPPVIVGKLLPFGLGLCALVMFFVVTGTVLDLKRVLVASVLFIISPLFIVLFTTLNPYSLLLVMVLLSWWLFVKDSWLLWPVMLSLIFIDALGFIAAALALLAYGLFVRRGKDLLGLLLAGLVIIAVVNVLFGYVAANELVTIANLTSFFVSLGSSFGFSLFILVLSLMGWVRVWSPKNRFVFPSLLVFVLLFFSFSLPVVRVILLPLTALFGALGLLSLLERRWAVESIRRETLFLIFLSLLFTTILVLTAQVEQEPTLQKVEAMNFLRTVPDDELVLSSQDNGIFIGIIGRREAFIDRVRHNPLERRDEVADEIFYSQEIERTKELLDTHGITHILIDAHMRDTLWSSDEQGLLFFLAHGYGFVEVFSNDQVQVYRYLEQ